MPKTILWLPFHQIQKHHKINPQKEKRKKAGSMDETLKKEALGSLVWIHGTLLEHGVDLFIPVISRDLLDVLDHSPHVSRDCNPSAHLRRDLGTDQ